jgi:hypothetical protein
VASGHSAFSALVQAIVDGDAAVKALLLERHRATG